jgi:AbrB family looped-hinge helix DNA binding protein
MSGTAMSTPPESAPTATVSSKGQVVIPSAIRRRLKLVQGSVVRFLIEGDGVVRLLPEAGDVRRLKGRLTPPSRRVSIEAMTAAIVARRAGVVAATKPGKPTTPRRDRP